MSQDAEDRLKHKIQIVLKDRFDIYPEVWGVHASTGRKLRIDFILKPTTEMVEDGFPDIVIGLEVKSPEPDGSHSKATKLASQAMDYAESSFGEFGRPAFVMVFPKIDDHFPKPHNSKGLDETLLAIRLLRNLMQLRGIANLTGKTTEDGSVDWRIEAGHSQYVWSKSDGKGAFCDPFLNRDKWRGSNG